MTSPITAKDDEWAGREIKFRAWDERQKVMLPGISVNLDTSEGNNG